MEVHEVIKRPLLSEKTNIMKAENNQVAFEVHPKASKNDIRHAVSKLFEVKIKGVSTSVVHGKIKTVGRHRGRQANWKKAVVTLAEGETLEFFEGV